MLPLFISAVLLLSLKAISVHHQLLCFLPYCTAIFTLLGLAQDMIVAGLSHILCLISGDVLIEGQGIVSKSATLQSHIRHPQTTGIAEGICGLWGKEQELWQGHWQKCFFSDISLAL